jgi:hypothetical protein
MRVEVPPAVLSKPPGSLVAAVVQGALVLFLREAEWDLKRYPPACVVEMRLGWWKIGKVQLVSLIVRLAHNEATTFDCPLDVRNPAGVRMLQCLAAQSHVEVHLVGEKTVRTFRAANPSPVAVASLVDRFHSLQPWSEEDNQRALGRLNQLYPTAADLWLGSAANPGG